MHPFPTKSGWRRQIVIDAKNLLDCLRRLEEKLDDFLEKYIADHPEVDRENAVEGVKQLKPGFEDYFKKKSLCLIRIVK